MNEWIWIFILSAQIQYSKNSKKNRTVSTGQKGSKSTYNCHKRYVNEEFKSPRRCGSKCRSSMGLQTSGWLARRGRVKSGGDTTSRKKILWPFVCCNRLLTSRGLMELHMEKVADFVLVFVRLFLLHCDNIQSQLTVIGELARRDRLPLSGVWQWMKRG